MKVAIVGIQGVPANYGGFESLVENIIGENCSPGIQYTIFCSSKDMSEKLKRYKGCQLKYVGLHANGISSIPYDIISMMRVIYGYDTILVLGTSGCIFLPALRLLSKSKLVVNIDGLEHRREKWGKLARKFLRLSESCAVRNANVIVADNKGIQDYVTDTYHKPSKLIAYGGDHVLRNVADDKQQSILEQYGLASKKYAITVCRIEPENNCHVTLEAFAQTGKTLVFIGNWQHSDYAINLHKAYSEHQNIKLLDAIYDLDTLFTLRSHASYYIHGHSAGGTNPSLVEAMFFGHPIIAYDVIYNRETTHNQAFYFRDVKELIQLLSKNDLDGSTMLQIAEENYMWHHIAKQYEELY
jgi:glycosyltransferase involved in cell wall biosynthesis